jgi:hypothetical protein
LHISPKHWQLQCCGSGMFISDPGYSVPGSNRSRIRIRIKEFNVFNPENCFEALGNLILDPEICPITDRGSRGQKAPDPGSTILDNVQVVLWTRNYFFRFRILDP